METKKIYLIRHGQTEFNKKGIVQGSGVDSDLNETGIAQALRFFNTYKNIPFDKVYISTLKRTKQSVQNFLDLNIPVEAHSGLNEINWGNREGKVITEKDNAYYYSILEAWTAGKTDIPMEGGESPEDVLARQKPVIETILSRPEEKTILICMHGRAMRILLSYLLNYELRYMDVFEHHNLGLYKLNYTGSMFNIELFNDTSHLI